MCGGEDVGRREHQEANAVLGKQSKRLGRGASFSDFSTL